MKIHSPNPQFLVGVILFLITIAIGFVGYRVAGWPALESIYMVIITIFGVGYGEVRELSPELRRFTTVFIVPRWSSWRRPYCPEQSMVGDWLSETWSANT